MPVRPILLYPEPILREVCAPVERFDQELADLAAAMIDTMRAAPGVGLAAPQVGVAIRLAVIDASQGKVSEDLRILVNPEIEEATGSAIEMEGCLSIPEFTEKVDRPAWLRVRAFDAAGREFRFEAEGLAARAVCHELDHLDGILFVDRLRGLRRERARRALRRMLRDQAPPEGREAEA